MRNAILSILVLSLVLFISSCGEPSQEDNSIVYEETKEQLHEHFFDNLSAFCGSTFSGRATYPDDSSQPLVDTELVNYISHCDDQMIRIELFRDTDYWHGAWVLEKREQGLHLFHDHLGEVRTKDDLGEGDYHGYGGYADERGTGLHQHFPADEVTAEMIPAAATNVWMMQLDPENDRFIYHLERHGEKRFRAEVYLQEEPPAEIE
ncbi:hypothetical protein QLX67_12445 [Balneolaceae bacterium ANBcel3]|nr:hypothetical protein [Balneolaceae bacterium ANBcel3]